jgi:pyrroloquinoline quinone (PQQ) biosynthesis protein C
MAANPFEQVKSAWLEQVQIMNQSYWFQRLQKGDLDLAHYKGYLQETYHHAGLNPQIQAFATMYFKENHRELFGMFYKHATSEIGHDLLALGDLVALGESREKALQSRPLPTTAAYNAWVIYQIQFVSPLAYLGYLFHLEFLPTLQGREHINVLKKLGVPENALTFLEEHATVDVGHNRLMMKYVDELIKTPADIEMVSNAARDAFVLHQKMIEASFENGERLFKR